MELNSKTTSKYVFNIIVLIFVLEPVWMLFPFAGFLYGGMVKLDLFYDIPAISWLSYFVLPALQTTLPIAFPFALSLTFIGLFIFVIGAFQIYRAKIKKSGLVKSGLYRKLRHPQYTGLIIFCLGFILIWGRFLTCILFTTMLFSYYLLAKKEESDCVKRFGREYEKYQQTSYFLFPGEKIVSPLGRWGKSWIPNKILRIFLAFLLLQGATICSGFLILKVRTLNMKQLSFVQSSIRDDTNKEIELILVNSENDTLRDEFIKKLTTSSKIKNALSTISTEQVNTIFTFDIYRTIRNEKSYYSQGRVDLYMVLLYSPIKLTTNNFHTFQSNWQIKGALLVNEVDIPHVFSDKDIVSGEITVMKPVSETHNDIVHKKIETFTHAYLFALGREKTNRFIHFMHEIEHALENSSAS